ncbi:hypothetical protein A9267_20265 [Shewanella sp. UCD-FRSSP16_17]|uniref:hypothetical protein n=1 Tax=Shewanella sp. UCD-FRSSP16_17 TaxID=1853256 RepID=UPI0007EEC05A|nr:hypothetical protein [Shewanella sp. UCD-FRSSP16_17]OBT09913.1 hypothetical protein A9267_20265 [Shewanella sp. UCD-FRSSP16_17]
METSTVLQKTRRYRICEKTKLNNLVNHIMRNYKPETIQYKRDFNPEDTKENLLIGSDFQIKEKGSDWFNQVELESKLFKDNLEQSLIDADKFAVQKISLSRSEKDKTIKSINYFSNLENYDHDLEIDITPVISKCLDFKIQDKNNKDYSVIDKKEIQTALDFYSNIPKDKKVKSLNAKKKNLTQILGNVDAMKVANDRRATASTRAIGFEEVLFKIPKHNDKSLKDVDMISIIKDWNDEHYANFQVLGGAFHKDERTTKGNAVDDHLHLIRSGFNRDTKRFDLPDFTHQKGLEMAKKQGVDFVTDGKKFNETTEDLRTIASEALQTEFYSFANKRLKKLGYDFRFEKKELTPEEKELRTFLKEQSTLPKSQRVQNMHSYFEEKTKENIEKALKANKFVNNKKVELVEIKEVRNRKIIEANKAIKIKKETVDKTHLAKNKLDEINNFIERKYDLLDSINKKVVEALSSAVEYAMNSLPQSLKTYLERQEDIKIYSESLSLEVEEKAIEIQPTKEMKSKIRNGKRNRFKGF